MTDLYTQPGVVPNFNWLNPSPTVPFLIGISGYARAGKDSVAQVIHRLYGHQPVMFAGPLKALAYAVDNYVAFPTTDKVRMGEMVDSIGWEEAKEHDEVRRILQRLGTKAREIIDPDIWVNTAFRDIWENSRAGDQFVFSDCRFPNEAQAIKSAGGAVLRVIRPGIKAVNKHVSETALDDWDFDGIIVNDGTLLDLQGEVQRVLGEFDD